MFYCFFERKEKKSLWPLPNDLPEHAAWVLLEKASCGSPRDDFQHWGIFSLLHRQSTEPFTAGIFFSSAHKPCHCWAGPTLRLMSFAISGTTVSAPNCPPCLQPSNLQPLELSSYMSELTMPFSCLKAHLTGYGTKWNLQCMTHKPFPTWPTNTHLHKHTHTHILIQ